MRGLSAAHVCLQSGVLPDLLFLQAGHPHDYQKTQGEEMCYGHHADSLFYLHGGLDPGRIPLRVPDANATQAAFQDCWLVPNMPDVVPRNTVRLQRHTAEAVLREGPSGLETKTERQLSFHVFGPTAGRLSDFVPAYVTCLVYVLQDRADGSGGPEFLFDLGDRVPDFATIYAPLHDSERLQEQQDPRCGPERPRPRDFLVCADTVQRLLLASQFDRSFRLEISITHHKPLFSNLDPFSECDNREPQAVAF